MQELNAKWLETASAERSFVAVLLRCVFRRATLLKQWRRAGLPGQTVLMDYRDDPAAYEARLRTKLQPANLRATMAFAGLYQMTSEMIKYAVVDKVRDFYWIDGEGNSAFFSENKERYREQVLSLARNEFTASLLWLVQSDAVTQEQADRLGAIHAHRNELTHELARYLVDVNAEPDIELLAEALVILKDVHRFWIEVELSTGGFCLPDGDEFADIDPEDVAPASLILLQQCIEAYVDGLAATGPST